MKTILGDAKKTEAGTAAERARAGRLAPRNRGARMAVAGVTAWALLAATAAWALLAATAAWATNEVWRQPSFDHKWQMSQPDGGASWSNAPALKWRMAIGSVGVSSLFNVDMNGDGEADIVADVAGGVSAYTLGGIRLWSSRRGLSVQYITDIDGDGEMEVICAATTKQTVILNGRSGALRWASPYAPNANQFAISFTRDFYNSTRGYMADADGDGIQELFWGLNDETGDGGVWGTNSFHCYTFTNGIECGALKWRLGSMVCVCGGIMAVGHFAQDARLLAWLDFSGGENYYGAYLDERVVNLADGSVVASNYWHPGGYFYNIQPRTERVVMNGTPAAAAEVIYLDYANSGNISTMYMRRYRFQGTGISQEEYREVPTYYDGQDYRPVPHGRLFYSDFDLDGKHELVYSVRDGYPSNTAWVVYWYDSTLSAHNPVAAAGNYEVIGVMDCAGDIRDEALLRSDDGGSHRIMQWIGSGFNVLYTTPNKYMGTYEIGRAGYVAEKDGEDIVLRTWKGGGNVIRLEQGTLPAGLEFLAVLGVVESGAGERIQVSATDGGIYFYDSQGNLDNGRKVEMASYNSDYNLNSVVGRTTRGVETAVLTPDGNIMGVYENGGSPVTHLWTTNNNVISPMAFSDFNGDGYDDLLVREEAADSRYYVWRVYDGANDGVTVWTSAQFANYKSFVEDSWNLYDADGDGTQDVVFTRILQPAVASPNMALVDGANGTTRWTTSLSDYESPNQNYPYCPSYPRASGLIHEFGDYRISDGHSYAYSLRACDGVVAGYTNLGAYSAGYPIDWKRCVYLRHSSFGSGIGAFVDNVGNGNAGVKRDMWSEVPVNSRALVNCDVPNILNELVAGNIDGDGDGDDEMVQNVWQNYRLRAMEYGAEAAGAKWYIDLTNEYLGGAAPAGGSWFTRRALLADVDRGDAGPELVVASDAGNIYCFRTSGSSSGNSYAARLKWKIELGMNVRALKAVDTDGDGELELLGVGYDGYLYCFDASTTADLEVRALDVAVVDMSNNVASAAAVGNKYKIRATIYNRGGAASAVCNVYVTDDVASQFRRASGATVEYADMTLPTIPAGGVWTVDTYANDGRFVRFAPSVAGIHTLTVSITNMNDASLGNNVAVLPVKVYATLDAEVIDISVAHGVISATNEVQVTVQNILTGAPPVYANVVLREGSYYFNDEKNADMVTGAVIGAKNVLLQSDSTSVVTFAWVAGAATAQTLFAVVNMNDISGEHFAEPDSSAITSYQEVKREYEANAAYLNNVMFSDIALSNDSDDDDMPDAWEQQYFGNPTSANPGGDADGEGLSNLDEFKAGTNPLDEDTDDDMFIGFGNDYYEVKVSQTDPLDWDTDDGGINDGFELYYQTVPGYDVFNPNDDGDYFPKPVITLTTQSGEVISNGTPTTVQIEGTTTNVLGGRIRNTTTGVDTVLDVPGSFSHVVQLNFGANTIYVEGTNVAGASTRSATITLTVVNPNTQPAEAIEAARAADNQGIVISWSNAPTVTIMAQTDQYYNAAGPWFELAAGVASPWTHTDASNYWAVFYRVVNSGVTGAYDVGKMSITVPGSNLFSHVASPFEVFGERSVSNIFGTQLTAGTLLGGDQVLGQSVAGADVSPIARYRTGTPNYWYYVLPEYATNVPVNHGLLVRCANEVTLTFVGAVPTNTVQVAREIAGGNLFTLLGMNWCAPVAISDLFGTQLTAGTLLGGDQYLLQTTLGGDMSPAARYRSGTPNYWYYIVPEGSNAWPMRVFMLRAQHSTNLVYHIE